MLMCLSESPYHLIEPANIHFTSRISIAILMSFAARALTAIPNHIFCYQAISSSAVVLILPGYLIRMWTPSFPLLYG